LSGLLDKINSPNDLKQLNHKDYPLLCEEIRNTLIETVSKNGGHLASNLGVVELTVALHLMFSTPKDQIVWDVGHQCYTHKLLTGRRDSFDTLRREGGIAGFPRRRESEHDCFVGGHASTSISAATGLARAKTLKGENGHVIAVIGDGSLTGGLAFEAMNNSSRIKGRLIVILNDNKMSISKSVGSMARYLMSIRTKPLYFKVKTFMDKALRHIPLIGNPIRKMLLRSKSLIKNAVYHSTIFEEMGFSYMGPIDGHDIKSLCTNLEYAKKHKSPVLIHVMTVKGKGYGHAEKTPQNYHGISGFDMLTGDINQGLDNYSENFGTYLCRIAKTDRRIVAITAAMKLGTGLGKFSYEFRDRFFDVGIAEEHAVTFCAGLAANGMIPVFAVYSTFLQRSYDQLIHDAALQELKIVIAVDRAGIVGDDGETHQGLFDVSFLSSIPNITIYSPTYYSEQEAFFDKAIYHDPSVVAIRYPRGKAPEIPKDFKPSCGDFDIVGGQSGKRLIITYGRLFDDAYKACMQSEDVSLIKINKIKPLDNTIIDIALNFDKVYVFEEAVVRGGVGEHIGTLLLSRSYKGTLKIHGIDDKFVEQGETCSILKKSGLDTTGMLTALGDNIDE